MKKILCILVMGLLLTGCGEMVSSDNNINTESSKENNLKDPKLVWCEVYNPNGFNTVTCEVSNPNKEDIDITYDLVYYKNGNEVARSESFANFSLSHKHNGIIWGNVDIPNPEEVDDVKMENIVATEAYNKYVDYTIKESKVEDGKAYFDISFDNPITIANVWFLLYNDNNGNKKFDKGEIVATSLSSTTKQKDTIYYETDVSSHTNYAIYVEAY